MNPEVTYIPRAKIVEACQSLPTPFFLYEEKRLRHNCRRLADAFIKHFPDFDPLYAVKANPNPHLLKIIMDEGYGFDCSSLSEAWLAGKLGARGMYIGNYSLENEFRAALEAGLLLNLDDISLIPLTKKIGFPKQISFRINPGLGQGSMESLVLAGPDAKFGVPHELAPQAYALAREAGATTFGMHMMTGSNVLDERYFAVVVERQLEIAANIKRETGIEISFMNIGGGFGVPYRPDERCLDLAMLARGIAKVVANKCPKLGIAPPRLMAEPGRFIGAGAGWLVSQVQVIKEGYKKFVGIDANANDMPRPSIYGAYHHISVLNRSKELESVSVVGRVCENSDQFAKDRLLPKCAPGDIVAIHNCGAHAYAMGHNYNGHTRHAEYLLKTDGSITQIRRAETIEDLFATVTLP